MFDERQTDLMRSIKASISKYETLLKSELAGEWLVYGMPRRAAQHVQMMFQSTLRLPYDRNDVMRYDPDAESDTGEPAIIWNENIGEQDDDYKIERINSLDYVVGAEELISRSLNERDDENLIQRKKPKHKLNKKQKKRKMPGKCNCCKNSVKRENKTTPIVQKPSTPQPFAIESKGHTKPSLQNANKTSDNNYDYYDSVLPAVEIVYTEESITENDSFMNHGQQSNAGSGDVGTHIDNNLFDNNSEMRADMDHGKQSHGLQLGAGVNFGGLHFGGGFAGKAPKLLSGKSLGEHLKNTKKELKTLARSVG